MVGIGRATEKQRGRAKRRPECSWRAGGEGLEVDISGPRPKLKQGSWGMGVGGGQGGGSNGKCESESGLVTNHLQKDGNIFPVGWN